MLNSSRRNIAYPNTSTRADAPDIPAHIKNLIDAIDVDAVYGQGIFSARPVSTGGSPGLSGRFYYSTDTVELYFDYGTGWVLLYPQSGVSVPIGGSLDWDYAAASIPAWALLQYGQAVSRVTYSALNALASAAGYPHGNGDGSTTFNIADKRGRVSAGKDDMGGSTASRITAAVSGTAGTVLGAAVGAEGVTLSSGTIPSHTHTVTGAPGLTDPTHRHGMYRGTNNNTPGGFTWAGVGDNVSNDGDVVTDYASTGITAGVGTLATASVGSGGAHLNVQPTIICNKIVRVL